MAQDQPAPDQIKAGQDLLPMIEKLENSGDGDVSSAGAIGRYQIMPGTARQYGFDPTKLSDPDYSAKASATILNDLWRRYKGNATDVLAAYNAGPTVANRWIAGGRKDGLPKETVNYLNRASTYMRGAPQPPTVGTGADDAPQPERAPLPPGKQAYQQLIDGGFSAQEANQWKLDQTTKLAQGGFTPQEIDNYWGEAPPNPAAIDTHVQDNFARTDPEKVPRVASTPLEQIAAGWDMSVTGLANKGHLPDTVLPENAGVVPRVLAGGAQMIGDLPYMAMGLAGGAAMGEAAAPELGPVGPSVGGLFGAGALPQAMRETMIDYYRRGEIHSAKDFLAMAGKSVLNTAKVGLLTAFAGRAGQVVGEAAAPLVGNRIGGMANAATQVAAFTGGQSALDRKMPDAADFATGAILMLGPHVAGEIAAGRAKPSEGATDTTMSHQLDFQSKQVKTLRSSLEELYKQTGIMPWDAVAAARTNPVLRDELFGEDVNGERNFDNFRKLTTEPDPYHEPQPTNLVGLDHGSEPPVSESHGLTVSPDWILESRFPGQRVARLLPSGQMIADPNAVADYLQKFGDMAGFHFQVAPGAKTSAGEHVTPPEQRPQYQNVFYAKTRKSIASQVFIPDTPDELNRRWYGLGQSEIIYHEVGHALDHKVLHSGGGYDYTTQRELSPELHEEMKAASQEFAPKLWKTHPEHRSKPDELMADSIAAWLSNPSLRQRMPLFTAKYGEKLKPYLDIANKSLPRRIGDTDNWELPPGDDGKVGGNGPPGGQPPAPPPGGSASGEPPSRPQIDLDPTLKLDYRMRNEIANEFIGEPVEDNKMLDPAFHYRQWVSELGPARAIDKMLIAQGFDAKTRMGLEDMFRQTYASDARAGYFVRKGGLDPITFKPTGAPSVLDAVNAVREDTKGSKYGDTALNDWRNYMVAKRALDKAAQGYETGHPLPIKELAELVKEGEPLFKRGTNMLQRTLDSALDYGRDSGVFSQDQIDAMRRDNPIYISFRRLMGDMETAPGPRSGRGFKVREPVRRFEGDDRRIIDPMLATIDNLHQIIRMADRNRAVGSVVQLAEQHGLTADLGLKRIGKPEVKMSIAEPGSEVFKPYDVNAGEPYEPFLAARAQRFGGWKPNQFMFIRGGKPELWEAKDEALASLIRGADTPGEANIAVRLAQSVAQFQRAGIVNSIDFPARVTLRHQMTAFIADRTNPPPFVTWLRGAFHAFKGDEVYWDWVANGGAGTSLVELDRDVIQRDMQKVFEETGVWDRMWNTVRHPLEAAQILSERMDAAARIGYKLNAESKGIEPLKAATMGRKAMLDYVERGTSAFVQQWARAVPFMRPHILGLKQFGEAAMENPGSTLLKSLAAVTLPTAVLYVLNYMQDEYGGLPENEKYKNLPRYWKDGMWILPQVAGVRVRIPYPFVVGVPFGGFTNRFLDHFVQHDKAAFEDWGSALLAEAIPPFIPSLVLPPLEHYTNTKFFSGHKLIPGSLEQASAPMQYTENTSEPAKALSRVLGKAGVDMSPIVMENYVKEYTGSLGMLALKALNAPFKVSGAPWEMSDIPFVQSFLIRHPGLSAAPIEGFFDARSKFETEIADKRLALRRMKAGAPNQQEVNDTLLNSSEEQLRSLNNVANTIHLQQALVLAINSNKTMTTDEKRQATDTAYNNMILTAQFGLKTIEALNNGRK